MSIMYIYIKCKRYNCFKKEAGKYKLFEYTESPNVFSDERLQSADSAGGHDSSQHQRLSLERNIYFQINPLSLFFLSFYPGRKEKLSKGLCRRKKQKGKQTLLGDVLHKGVWGRQALSKGKDQKTCRRYKRPSQGLDKSKSSSVEILKAKIPMFFSDFPEKDLHIFRRGNICFKNFHSLFDGPTCLNKHYSSIHGRPL